LTRPALESASIILRSNIGELRNNIIQKGLAFGRDWSGAVANSERVRTLRDPGASVVRRDAASTERRILMSKSIRKRSAAPVLKGMQRPVSAFNILGMRDLQARAS
jgi:hypothetical protein